MLLLGLDLLPMSLRCRGSARGALRPTTPPPPTTPALNRCVRTSAALAVFPTISKSSALAKVRNSGTERGVRRVLQGRQDHSHQVGFGDRGELPRCALGLLPEDQIFRHAVARRKCQFARGPPRLLFDLVAHSCPPGVAENRHASRRTSRSTSPPRASTGAAARRRGPTSRIAARTAEPLSRCAEGSLAFSSAGLASAELCQKIFASSA